MAGSPPSLAVPRSEAEQQIRHQIEKGVELRDRAIPSASEFEATKSEYVRWTKYTLYLLAVLFDNRSLADEYSDAFLRTISIWPSLDGKVGELREEITMKITVLESIVDRLGLMPEALRAPLAEQKLVSKKNVFIVHGHDESVKEAVARWIGLIGLNPVILAEQPYASTTLLQNHLDSKEQAGFAVVLLTPDDEGHPWGKPDQKRPRARQNVVFELGLFIAALRPENVLALLKKDPERGEFERPSNIDGVHYESFDGEWKLRLAQILDNAGMDVNWGRLRKQPEG